MRKTRIRIAAAAAALCLALCLPGKARAAQEDLDRVNAMISALPAEEDIKEEDADAVKEAMDAYRVLAMSEKVHVEGYDKLLAEYENFLETGLIRDEKREREAEQKKARDEQSSLTPSAKTEAGVTSYVFTITDNEPSLSIVMRYVTDRDGDGYGDVPDGIVLTSPSGQKNAITQGNVGIKNEEEKLDIILTWEPKFLQLDIASAERGNWTLSAMDPADISSTAYRGPRQEIKAEGEKTKEDAAPEQEGQDVDKKGGFPWRRTLLAFAATAAAFVFMKTRKKDGEEDEDEEDDVEEDAEPPEDLTREERLQQVRQERAAREEQERLREEAELRAEEEEAYIKAQEEAAKENIDGYEEGETDLLSQKENPAKNGGGLRTGGFFSSSRFD